MALDIDRLLSPSILSSLHEDIPPVECVVWMGKDRYETIEIKAYPFDTLDMIKFMICERYPAFHPRYLFVGIPNEDAPPSQSTTYLPLDYLWYSSQTQSVRETHSLYHPIKSIEQGDDWFVTADGSYASPIMEMRGRSTIEDVFLKPSGGYIPVLHVYSLSTLLNSYRGLTPISEVDWNKRFASYFPDVPLQGPYRPTSEDISFSKTIHTVVTKRTAILGKLNQLIEDSIMNNNLQVSGVQHLMLIWKKPIQGFEGVASLFYRIPVTERRPYLRLLPADGSPITKLHVKGVIPIPTLEDPYVLDGWGEETSPDPTKDVCVMKYVHLKSIGSMQPIYGTIFILDDGTMNLTIQPPKTIKKLKPIYDFNEFRAHIGNIMNGLPQPMDEYDLHEMSIQITVSVDLQSKRFTKARIMERLSYFQPLLTTIESLPNDNSIISLRYTAISQYASEDNVFQFLTQYAMQLRLTGISFELKQLIDILQEQFQFSTPYATEICRNWLKKRETFTLQQPDEGEFAESFHPGIDIHIYDKHPEYHISIHRINSYENYIRLYTILSILFVENDRYFPVKMLDVGLSVATQKVDSKILLQEGIYQGKQEAKEDTDESYPSFDDILEEEPVELTAASASQKDMMHPRSAIVMDEMVSKKAAEPAVSIRTPLREVDSTSWFISRLQEIDNELFKFTPAGGDNNGYTRKCARNEDRQPVVFTKEQYERMKEIYKNDSVFWIEYPLLGKEDPIQPKGTTYTITVMRYGSNIHNINYYFCPEYFCLVDEMMILPRDFENNRDREGQPKPRNSCPFCKGTLIGNSKGKILGQTVIRREKVRGGDTSNLYIRFLTKTSHPRKLELPCCFTTSKHIRLFKNTAFDEIRAALQEDEPIPAEDDVKDFGDMLYPTDTVIPYGSYLLTIQKRNILESNKYLIPGAFGMATPVFDAFFKQNSLNTIVKRVTGNLKLRPNAHGFLRMGTENPINESLLGVIAPLLYLNNIKQVKERIIDAVVPRIFMNAHFGNLVLEFYDPRDTEAMPANQNELKMWSKEHLGIDITSNNRYHLLRIYNSHHRFIDFIKDPYQRKDLRHLQPLLAEPGLFRQEGLQLLIMNENGSEPVSISCPIFGVSMERHRLNEIAFVSRTILDTKHTSYNLYIYTSNRPAQGAQGDIHEPIIRWNYESRRYWPSIVKMRIDEYMTQCQSRYRTLYTPQPTINPMAMLPLSKAVDASPDSIEGLVKDTYNHVIGITFRIKPGNHPVVMLPVIDDGFVSIAFSVDHIYLDIDDLNLAPLEDSITYYETKLSSLFALYPGYHIKYIARKKTGAQQGEIDALQLENGVYLPVGRPRNPEMWENEGNRKQLYEKYRLQGMITYTHLQWNIDSEIQGQNWNPDEKEWKSSFESLHEEKSCGKDPTITSTYREWEELYQQFRLMVSNWLTSDRAGPMMREEIEKIIFNHNLPEYERRKRLYIYLSPIMLNWFYPDNEYKWDKGISSFLRKDCNIIDQPDACTGTCHWKQDEGKCLLHVSDTTELGEKRNVSTPELFTKRVIDELVRFPARRKQLLHTGGISKVASLLQPIHDGDQYIIPESSTTWTNLLRMDWTITASEKPKYYEEHSREEDITDMKEMEQGEIPPELKEILGMDTPLRMIVPDVRSSSSRMPPLLPFTSILGLTLDRLGLSAVDIRFKRDNLKEYVKETNRPIGMINLSGQKEPDEEIIQFVKPFTGSFQSVLILVFLPDRAGILIEKIGVSTVQVNQFAGQMKSRWESAGRVKTKHKMVDVDTVDELPILVQQHMQTKTSSAL